MLLPRLQQSNPDFSSLNSRFGLGFEGYFRVDLQCLEALVVDGLVAFEPNAIRVTERGRLLLRNIAMVFEAYLTGSSAQQVFSKAI